MGFRLERVKRDWNRFIKIDIRRFTDNVRDFRTDPLAREDLSHSYVNVFVEGVRMSAYLVGHILALIPVILVVGAVLNAISWLLVN